MGQEGEQAKQQQKYASYLLRVKMARLRGGNVSKVLAT